MLLTRLPLPVAEAFDLHVLGLPPAFVLSQDQTLKLNEICSRLVTISLDESRTHSLQNDLPHDKSKRMVFENVTVDSLFATLASQQRSRKDTAVHVSLSSDLHVKQRSHLNQNAVDSEVLRLPGTMRHRRSRKRATSQ